MVRGNKTQRHNVLRRRGVLHSWALEDMLLRKCRQGVPDGEKGTAEDKFQQQVETPKDGLVSYLAAVSALFELVII